MNKSLQATLWENIRTFQLDESDSAFPFSKKLQVENNWTSAFTTTAIEEYRRFIFLCCIVPNGASPSDIVDKVWHLHLTYTTNYWIAFCRNTLHKDIHHFPAKGGNDEKTKHVEWYRQTLAAYEKIFKSPPPAVIWPPATQSPEKKVGIDLYAKSFFQNTILVFIILILFFIAATNLFKSKGPDFLLYYFIIIVAGLVASLILQEHKLKKIEHYIYLNFPEKCNPYQAANFLHGLHRAYQTALIDLLKRNIIDVSADGYKLIKAQSGNEENKDNPLLPAVTQNRIVGSTFSYHEGLELMDTEKLQLSSLQHLNSISQIVDYQKFIIPGIVLAIGFARLFQGLANEKPVMFLVSEIGIFSLITSMIAAQYSYTYLVFKKSKSIWMNKNNNGYSDNILNNFTLLGVIAVAGFAEYPTLARVFGAVTPIAASSDNGSFSGSINSCSSGSDGSGGDSSGGDSGGGSGCGGGCGGCGGGD